MKKIFSFAFALLFFPVGALANSTLQTVSIERKIIIEVPNTTVFEKSSILNATLHGVKKEFRFVGVNTDRHAYSPCSRETSAYEVQRYLRDKEVDLESDPFMGNGSDDGIVSRYVRLPDGQILNELLIKEGVCYVNSDREFEQKGAYLELEREARENKKGVWGSKIKCEVESFLNIRNISQEESFIYNISVYQILQYIALILLLLVLALIGHFYARGRK